MLYICRGASLTPLVGLRYVYSRVVTSVWSLFVSDLLVVSDRHGLFSLLSVPNLGINLLVSQVWDAGSFSVGQIWEADCVFPKNVPLRRIWRPESGNKHARFPSLGRGLFLSGANLGSGRCFSHNCPAETRLTSQIWEGQRVLHKFVPLERSGVHWFACIGRRLVVGVLAVYCHQVVTCQSNGRPIQGTPAALSLSNRCSVTSSRKQ